MTIDEADQALAEWRSRLRRIDENLVALQLDPTHTRLEQSKDGGLEGATRDRVVPALDAMRELFAQRGLLYDAVEQARHVRAALNRRRQAEGLREIESLLRGASIRLPASEIPLSRRSLLGATETALTPDQLLNAMVTSFERARDAVAAVNEAWRRLDAECARASAEADRLQAAASSLGEDATAGLRPVRSQLETVKLRIARDPLGASRSLTDEVFSRLGQLEQALSQIQQRREQVRGDLDRARAFLADLRKAHDRARIAHDRRSREIAPAAGEPGPAPPPSPARIDGLAEWLATLEGTVAAGRWSAAAVGLARWLATVQAALAEEEAALRASQAALDERDELLGRLLARRQQARVRAARGQAVDPTAEEVARQAETLLRRVPTPLAQAAALVAGYEARLRAGR